jgi:hypothetical protein
MIKSIALLPNYSFCLLLPTLSPCLQLPFPSSPTLSHTTPSSYTLTMCWSTYCTNFTQSQTQAPYTTTTEIYPNTQVPQNQAAPTSLPPLTPPTSCRPV